MTIANLLIRKDGKEAATCSPNVMAEGVKSLKKFIKALGVIAAASYLSDLALSRKANKNWLSIFEVSLIAVEIESTESLMKRETRGRTRSYVSVGTICKM